MAFQDPKKPYQQLFPTITPGFHYQDKYHNIGQLRTPYIGKKMGQEGDYAPPQRTLYYSPSNPVYPYVMDRDFHPVSYLPTEGCCYRFNKGYFPCYENKYPSKYDPPDFFSPHTRYPTGHSLGPFEVENYEKLPVAYPSLKHANDFPPFNKYY